MKKQNTILIYPFAIMVLLLMLSNSCKKDDNNSTVPVLATSALNDMTQSTVICGGNVTSDGGSIITVRGVCWSIGTAPTITDSKTTNGTGTGSFLTTITGLSSNTIYYLRTYATNSAGTAYGNEISFILWLNMPGPSVTDVDINSYNSVKIGNQIWMAENLKVSHYRNGDPIPNVTDGTVLFNLTTGACCDFNNTPSNSIIYGKLYNWYTVNDSRNIAPTGWHVPSDAEWTILSHYLGGHNAGGKLKETGTNHWKSPNTGATNESGFTALPDDYRGDGGMFYINDFGSNGNWWSSTKDDTYGAWSRGVDYNSADMNFGHFYEASGYSVRCLRD